MPCSAGSKERKRKSALSFCSSSTTPNFALPQQPSCVVIKARPSTSDTMDRWHLASCKTPDVILVAPTNPARRSEGRRIPHCQSCYSAPDLASIHRAQPPSDQLPPPPPDEQPGQLNLWYPKCVEYGTGKKRTRGHHIRASERTWSELRKKNYNTRNGWHDKPDRSVMVPLIKRPPYVCRFQLDYRQTNSLDGDAIMVRAITDGQLLPRQQYFR